MQAHTIPWKVLDMYVRDNPTFLVKHHLQSYNDFFDRGLLQILREKNPIRFFKEQDKKGEYLHRADIYIGGKDGQRVYYGKPMIYPNAGEAKLMYPNEARLKNMSYSFAIHYDVDIDFTILSDDGSGRGTYNEDKRTVTLDKMFLGRFPVMLQSNLCILNGLAPQVRSSMGEDPTDDGGYFIVDGKEKVIISQEKFADNMLYLQKHKDDDLYSYSAKIRSVSEDASKPVRTLSVRLVAEQPSATNRQIVVSVPNVRKPIPLFILMRALGVISDKEIIRYCLLNLEHNTNYIDHFRPSVHDAGEIFTQETALKFIGSFTKGKSVAHTMEILMMYFLPHIGELNFKAKALYLGYTVKRLLQVSLGYEQPTNRDSYLYKRIEVPGMLIYDLFREYYILQQKKIFLMIDNEWFYNRTTLRYKGANFPKLVLDNIPQIFGHRIVETGFRRAFKGDWGSEAHTKRPGTLQDLSRLSYWSALCQRRKTNTHISADGAKIVGPRLLSSTQWGILCPIHTPDGGNVGLHKHLAFLTHITSGCSAYPFISHLRTLGIKLVEECSIDYLGETTKIFVNGAWIGAISEPQSLRNLLLSQRRLGLFSSYTSIRWNVERNELIVFTDSGRPCHPLFIIHGNRISYQQDDVIAQLEDNTMTWNMAVTGIAKKKISVDPDSCDIRTIKDVYGRDNINTVASSAIIEYLDTSEMEGVMLASLGEDQGNYVKKNITHREIHPSVILGVMANQIVYPSTNPYPRNLFSCGQSKQALSLYHQNYQNRMDKTAYILNYGQTPAVKSRYLEYASKGQHPYGLNAIVAVACYSGYNVEDAIIVNAAAVQRGLFSTTYLTVYEAEEEVETIGGETIAKRFMSIENHNVIGLRLGYDYSNLDPVSGIIKEGTLINDKTVLIGMATNSMTSNVAFIDASIVPKKGAVGIVDKAFMTEDDKGRRLAKVRIRYNRIPAIGDKFCSRAGQKGTIGIILPESDMPFTAEGLRPDIIVNPHAFPSRMTIGHLVESLVGKACLFQGAFGDCTAFVTRGPKDQMFGSLITRAGFSSTGNEIMYNGMTGGQLEVEIYLGPTYYLRLKHMVKDKINYRAKGPRTVLTRQTVQGRANNGGLRVGEMDRDALIAHGMSQFIEESMMIRGDQFFMAICNMTGTIAVYNESRDIFLSPLADGPLEFVGNLENELNVVRISRFGRKFSIIKVPYSFKLLYQELQAMNVQMRLITADNVSQMTTLTRSNDVKVLTGLPDLKAVVAKTKDALDEEKEGEIMEFASKGRQTEPSLVDQTSLWGVGPESLVDHGSSLVPQTMPGVAPEGWGVPLGTFGSMQMGAQPTMDRTFGSMQMGTQPAWGGKEAVSTGPTYDDDYDDDDFGFWDSGPTNEEMIKIEAEHAQRRAEQAAKELSIRIPGSNLDTSPPYQPISPTYGPTSPPYDPNTPTYRSNSPPYVPTSPPYDPNTPPYNPNQPVYTTVSADSPVYDPTVSYPGVVHTIPPLDLGQTGQLPVSDQPVVSETPVRQPVVPPPPTGISMLSPPLETSEKDGKDGDIKKVTA